jgi:hypothetical protein
MKCLLFEDWLPRFLSQLDGTESLSIMLRYAYLQGVVYATKESMVRIERIITASPEEKPPASISEQSQVSEKGEAIEPCHTEAQLDKLVEMARKA